MTLYQECDDCDATGCVNMMAFDCVTCDGKGFVPVEMGHVFTVGDPWDNEIWLPSLFPKGTRVAVIRIGGDE